MKKLLYIFFLFLFMQPVFAQNVKVEALSDFSTTNPPKTWKIKIVEGFTTKEGKIVYPNSIIEGDIIEVKSPKRLKRGASFKFVPKTYLNPHEVEKKEVKNDFVGKYSKLASNKKDLAKSTTLTAGNMLISPLVGIGVGLVEGAVKNEKNNRAKSAVISAYKNTPFSYVEKGEELEFKQGDIFVMKFKLNNDKEEDSEDNIEIEE